MRCVYILIFAMTAWAESHTVSIRQLTDRVSHEGMKKMKDAMKAHERGDSVKAMSLLSEALQREPDSTRLLLAAGVMALEYQDATRAATLLARAAELDPHDSKILGYAAVAHGATVDLTAAIDYARRSLKLDPTNQLSQFVLGLSLATKGIELREAIKLLEEVEMFQNQADLYLTWLYTKLGEHDKATQACHRYLGFIEPVDTCLRAIFDPANMSGATLPKISEAN